MCGLFFWVCAIFMTCNVHGGELTFDSPSRTKKRDYYELTHPISAQEHFDKALKLYSKYTKRPQKLQKMIVYKNRSIRQFSLALENSQISTTLLHKSLFYLNCLSNFMPIKDIQRLLLRNDAGIDDYNLVLKLLSPTSRFDLYDTALNKILSLEGLSLYNLTQNDYLERPSSPVLWERICTHPQAETKTLIKYATKLKTIAPEIARKGFEQAVLNKKLISRPESQIKIYLLSDGTPADQQYAQNQLREMGY